MEGCFLVKYFVVRYFLVRERGMCNIGFDKEGILGVEVFGSEDFVLVGIRVLV